VVVKTVALGLNKWRTIFNHKAHKGNLGGQEILAAIAASEIRSRAVELDAKLAELS
jgi:hypothetical protein